MGSDQHGSFDLGLKGQVTIGVRGQIWPIWSNFTQNCKLFFYIILRCDQHGSYGLGVKGQLTTGVRGQIWPNWSNYTQNCPVILGQRGCDQHGVIWLRGQRSTDYRGQMSNLAELVQLLPKLQRVIFRCDQRGSYGLGVKGHRGQRSNLAKLVQFYPKLPRVILRQLGVINMGL